MSGVDAALSRVRNLRSQIAQHQPARGGDFAAALARHEQDAPPTAAVSTLFGVPSAVRADEAITLGRLLNPAPIHTPAPYRASAGVMAAAELDRYLSVRAIPERNGHLHDNDLIETDGGWSGPVALLAPAAQAWDQMRAAAAADGIDLRAVDSYRDWATQDRAHREHLAGVKRANVLPPGHSEHGNGLAVDVTNGAIIGTDDAEWHWLQDNGHRFGWYPISNETWHWEFRGLGA